MTDATERARTPARASDRGGRQRDGASEERRVLVLYAGPDGHTHFVGDAIARRLRALSLGLVVELGDVLAGVMPPIADYDAVVLVIPVGFTQGTNSLADYLAANRADLDAVPTAIVSVCPDEPGHQHPTEHLEDLRLAGWRPVVTAALSCGRSHGALRDMFARRVTHFFGTFATPGDRRSVDWGALNGFADAVGKAAIARQRT